MCLTSGIPRKSPYLMLYKTMVTYAPPPLTETSLHFTHSVCRSFRTIARIKGAILP
jgi:hypothetical protein